MNLLPKVLEGSVVRLEPLTEAHAPPVTAAALSDPAIWTYIPYPMGTAAEVAATLGFALALQERGAAITHVTRLRETGEVIGTTSIRLVDPNVPSVEIGGTWIVPRWQRTAVNSEAKRLQLGHCFDVLGCERVELRTDVRNARSRAAMTRLGAKEEGVWRAHMRRADGTLRDSVYFSIVKTEWPAVRATLEARRAA